MKTKKIRLVSVVLTLIAGLVLSGCGGSSAASGGSTVPTVSSPVAAFTFAPSSPVSTQSVTFSDTSSGAPTAWSWNFGDNGTSSVRNPTHSYATAGTYTVTLMASNAAGSSSVSHPITVTSPVAAPIASFAYSPTSPLAHQAVGFWDSSTGSPTAWSWTFGDGGTSNVQNPSHTYATAGAYTVALTVSNNAGSNTSSQLVVVGASTGSPVASFSYSPVVPVAGESVNLANSSTGGATAFSWNFGDGMTGLVQSPSHSYSKPGAYTIALTAGNGTLSNVTTQLIAIYPAASGTVFNGTIILGSPEATSIKMNVMSPDESGMLQIEYGTSPGLYTHQTGATALVAGVPLTLSLEDLTADTKYYYRAILQPSGGSAARATPEYSFHTARPIGSTFTFTIQADSHLDQNTSPGIYQRTLTNIQSETPDFHVDLGDTFMCEKYSAPLTATSQTAPNKTTVNARYAFDRGNYNIITPAIPLFLANGNHEGESGWLNDGTVNNVAVWATLARHENFSNPTPDSFYSGDTTPQPNVGLRASWYAWRWGDALFIVLDPFWNSTQQPGSNGWNLTLGQAQYAWLQQTLAASTATFKFVFLHNLVGGLQGQMRGGAEAVPYYEWGGKNADGSDGFSTMRPGWAMPIHQLLVKYGVTAVFHGHDHLYAHQVLDGVVYQEVPQPSALNSNSGPNLASSYGYVNGRILSGSGHMRVTVGPKSVLVQYVRTWLPGDENASRHNGDIDDSYTIPAATSGQSH